MPHTQGFVYEDYRCPDCGWNEWWPGLSCTRCKGQGTYDFDLRPSRDGPPITPAPWQIVSRKWKEEDKEERLHTQRGREERERTKERRYNRYRQQCIPYKLLILSASEDYLNKAMRRLTPSFEVITRQTTETQHGVKETVVISFANVYRVQWDELFDIGWRPTKPIENTPENATQAVDKEVEGEATKNISKSQTSLSRQDLDPWEAYIANEGLKIIDLKVEHQQTLASGSESPEGMTTDHQASTKKNDRSAKPPKWDKAETVNKNFWKGIRKTID